MTSEKWRVKQWIRLPSHREERGLIEDDYVQYWAIMSNKERER